MKVREKTEDRLALVDAQFDKKLAIGLMSALLLFGALQLAIAGEWILALFPVAIVAGLVFYLKRSLLSSVVTFDKPADRITLIVTDRNGTQNWEWALSKVETAFVTDVRAADSALGGSRQRPNLRMKDGTEVPLRPYVSAGSQSIDAVAAIQHFLGQEITGAPAGWINPYKEY